MSNDLVPINADITEIVLPAGVWYDLEAAAEDTPQKSDHLAYRAWLT